MNYMFCDNLDDFVTIFLDNILVFGPSIEKHEAHLRWVFNQLRKHLLKAKMKSVVLVCKDWNTCDT